MNNKLLRKLTLSAVTLGVAAISATTSTFAWFTTNGSATASGVSGTVTSSGVTMLIKSPTGWKDENSSVKPVYDGSTIWDSNSTTFTTSSSSSAAEFKTSTNLVNEAGITSSLKPVSILNDTNTTASNSPTGTFYNKGEGASGHAYTSTASSSDYLHYQVIIAVSDLEADSTYDVKMQLPEIASAEASQYLLVDAGTGATAGSTIKVKIEDALSIGIKNTIITSSNKSSYGNTTEGSITSFASNTDASGYYHAVEEQQKVTVDSNSVDGDAITYYNNTFGANSITKPTSYDSCYKSSEYFNTTDSKWSTEANAKTLYSITGEKNGSFVCVTDLYFFIDGWDYQCFNAIGGLSLFADSANTITFTCTKQS